MRFPHLDLSEARGNHRQYQLLPLANLFITYSAKHIGVIWGLGWIKENEAGCFIKMSQFFPQLWTGSETPDRGQLTLQSIFCAWMPIYLSNFGPISWNQMEILWKLSTGWSNSKASVQWDRSLEKREPIELYFPKFSMPHKINSIFHCITTYMLFIFSIFYYLEANN